MLNRSKLYFNYLYYVSFNKLIIFTTILNFNKKILDKKKVTKIENNLLHKIKINNNMFTTH